MSKGKLFVISGASGVGKSSVLEEIMKARRDLTFSVSATTRAPRPGEQDKVHYYFITREEFQGMIHRGNFWNTAPTTAISTAPPGASWRKSSGIPM